MVDLFREQHTSGKYEQELKTFFNGLLKMNGLAKKMTFDALNAFSANPSAMRNILQESKEVEERVNQMEKEIDRMSQVIYTTRSPVASDFRLMMASSKIVTDLERIGDESKKIVSLVPKVVSSQKGVELKGCLRQLIDELKSMMEQTNFCLSRLDQSTAKKIIAHDRIINKHYNHVYGILVSKMKDGADYIDVSLNIMWSARSIERIGDHCRNIAESVIYIIEGRDIRHPDKDGDTSND